MLVASASGEAKCVAACASGEARRDDGVHFVLLGATAPSL